MKHLVISGARLQGDPVVFSMGLIVIGLPISSIIIFRFFIVISGN